MTEKLPDLDFREISRGLKEVGLPYQQQYHYALLRHFGTPENIKQATFLDVGSGIGNPLQDFVASFGAHVVNLDLDPRVINELSLTGAEARQGSIFDIPFKTGKFDGVLCSEVIDSVPQSVEELKQLFQEVYRVLKHGGLFLQRHLGYAGGLSHNLPDARGELDIFAQAGFHNIRLLERPETLDELYFSAVSTPNPQRVDEALKSNFNWVYRETDAYDNGYGIPRESMYWRLENDGLKYWNVEVLKRNIADALSNNRPLMLLNAIRSIIIHFWPEEKDESSLIEVAADFDFQFVQTYPQFIDEDYCRQKGLDISTARAFYKSYGLKAVINAWKQGKSSKFSFFGRGTNEVLTFNPDQRTVTYLPDVKDPEGLALKTRFDSVFGLNGLKY